jgi:hypothetical protein
MFRGGQSVVHRLPSGTTVTGYTPLPSATEPTKRLLGRAPQRGDEPVSLSVSIEVPAVVRRGCVHIGPGTNAHDMRAG